MNYLPTIIIFRNAIKLNYPHSKSKEGLNILPSHLLWMLDEIENMTDGEKASRWIGYVSRCLEDLKIFDNSQIRFIIRSNNNIIKNFLNKKDNDQSRIQF